ncbi:hypothetical protein ASG43_12450 [Aureimonas sp. Leaf454]|uniref:hypothetical protein n=1 Tax=Aureimonas sp. Leaf454 TaxID=1736381 RepID=UPI0006F42E02|nr:hypothetical protein [Aureimonas sp. Leaf454]KQT45110.1 hypothetical protein ASG43_12450 [Aureimonas sp. Leaf454]
MICRSAVAVLLALSVIHPALAEGAAETVRGFYAPTVWNPLESEDVSGLTGPALALFRRSAELSAQAGEMGCVDFVVTVGGQDYDEEEIATTIETEVTGRDDAGDTEVTARFQLFGERREMRWTMREDGDRWKVADLESPDDDWKLSTLPCN